MTTAQHEIASDLRIEMRRLGQSARAAAAVLARSDAVMRDRALVETAAALRVHADDILSANRHDVDAATKAGLGEAMLDRLMLNADRIEAMAAGIEEIARMADPVGRVLAEWDRPSGLRIQRVSVPLGVIGIIYESRPNVTADAGSLCLKSGNAVILRGGSEAVRSNAAIHACLREGLAVAGLPTNAVQRVPTQDHEAVGILLRDMAEFVDVIVP
ncbi:MAG TPA: aldehyde dehydrogenase family protein, partial [Gammaproteobacteria bacterium]|nr:aldehyde dehydrogenase family protein [Gammaproteobacteria bacterium]